MIAREWSFKTNCVIEVTEVPTRTYCESTLLKKGVAVDFVFFFALVYLYVFGEFPMSSKSGYLSNLTDRQWSQIEPLLPPQKEGGRNRFVDIRQVVNAIFYRSRTCCFWEMLPKDFPPKSTVYEYYRAWQRDGKRGRFHDALQEKVRL